MPVIAGYNDSLENIEATAEFIAKGLSNCIKRVSLLTYHWLEETRLKRLEVNYSVSTIPPSEEYLQELQSVFELFGLSAYICG
jgi:pyruvate-formate lyase-activating enzyme